MDASLVIGIIAFIFAVIALAIAAYAIFRPLQQNSVSANNLSVATVSTTSISKFSGYILYVSSVLSSLDLQNDPNFAIGSYFYIVNESGEDLSVTSSVYTFVGQSSITVTNVSSALLVKESNGQIGFFANQLRGASL
jgi:hypothetical protein